MINVYISLSTSNYKTLGMCLCLFILPEVWRRFCSVRVQYLTWMWSLTSEWPLGELASRLLSPPVCFNSITSRDCLWMIVDLQWLHIPDRSRRNLLPRAIRKICDPPITIDYSTAFFYVWTIFWSSQVRASIYFHWRSFTPSLGSGDFCRVPKSVRLCICSFDSWCGCIR